MRTLNTDEMLVVAGGNSIIGSGNGNGNHSQNGVQNHASSNAFPKQLIAQVNIGAAPFQDNSTHNGGTVNV
jgi:hypothetical protein